MFRCQVVDFVYPSSMSGESLPDLKDHGRCKIARGVIAHRKDLNSIDRLKTWRSRACYCNAQNGPNMHQRIRI